MISDLIYNVPQKYKFVYDKKSVKLSNCFKIAIQENWDELLNYEKKYTNGELYTVFSMEELFLVELGTNKARIFSDEINNR